MYAMEYHSAIRNDKYPPFPLMWMELEGIMLSEVSQSEKRNHHMVSLVGNIKIVTGIIRERRGTDWENLERETNHERLRTLGNEQG